MATYQNELTYGARVKMLQGNIVEQGKEIAVPFLFDLASGFTGWLLGRSIGRASLLIGAATLLGGKFHGLHQAINRAGKRGKNSEPVNGLAGLFDVYNSDSRVYCGDSPFVALGLGIMLGGAGAASNTTYRTDGKAKSFSERAKDALGEMKSDFMHRLYLDNFTSKKEEEKENTQTVNGVGEVEYFLAGSALTQEQDFSELDKIEEQLREEAQRYEAARNTQPSAHAATAKAYPVEGIYDDDELNAIPVTRIL